MTTIRACLARLNQEATIKLYTTRRCIGSPLATGTAAQLAGLGIPVKVPDDSTTESRATATDAASNPSRCSLPTTHAQSSTPRITEKPPTVTKTRHRTVQVTFAFEFSSPSDGFR